MGVKVKGDRKADRKDKGPEEGGQARSEVCRSQSGNPTRRNRFPPFKASVYGFWRAVTGGEVELGTAWWEEKQQGGIYVRIWPRCSKEESNSSGLDGHIKGTSSRTDVRAGTRYAALVAVTEERRVDVTLAVARLV